MYHKPLRIYFVQNQIGVRIRLLRRKMGTAVHKKPIHLLSLDCDEAHRSHRQAANSGYVETSR